jgi:phosphoribosyl-AMP cyclohydrolase
MYNDFYKSLETICTGDAIALQECISQLTFNTHGLIPVVTQDATSHQVLMLAWMSKEALELTLSSKHVTYWSRSRKQLWVKGETSGHSQTLVSMSFDCDGDSILCRVAQVGAACHTGRAECFYLTVDNDKQNIIVS